jgi:metal-responsive CopG/Arc/MetJ family transcriptional regulator
VLPIPLPAQGKLGERRAREIKARSADKRRTKTITIRLPAVLVEAIDELTNVGFYTNRTEVIRSILSQELPRRLARYQATDENSKELPVHEDGNKRKNVSVYMTKRMYANVNKMAKELKVSKSELIRMAIDCFFGEYGEVYLQLEVDER